MLKINSEVFFEFCDQKLIVSAFNQNSKKIYSNEISLINEDKFIDKINNEIITNIFNIEKVLDHQINFLNIILNLKKSFNIKFNISKKKGEEINSYNDVTYLIQDARSYILKYYKSYSILHIIIDNYYFDLKKYNKLVFEKNFNTFSIDLNFICYPINEINEFKKIFAKNNLSINKFICFEYLKNISKNNDVLEEDVHSLAYNFALGQNLDEVEIVPKKHKNRGFFEKLLDYLK